MNSIGATPDKRSVLPVFILFSGERHPKAKKLAMGEVPGFGMDIANRNLLKSFA